MIGTLPEALVRAREAVAPAMAAAVDRLDPSVQRIARYHLGWTDAEGRTVAAWGGKAVRPALALLAAEAAGAPAETAVPGAVAIELVHNFSLLHDDVMDGDRERRHRATAWAVFGVGPAICAGDALLVLAYQVLLEARPHGIAAAGLLSRASQEMIAGQTYDLAYEGRTDLSVDECRAMAAGKTGALLGAAAAIGAVVAGGGRDLVDGLDRFGREVGLAFQAVDDVLGIWGRPDVTGKPVGSDLRQRKASLPVVYALEPGGPAADELQRLLGDGSLDDDDIARATALIEANSGGRRVLAVADDHLARALDQLARTDMPAGVRAEFADIARFVTRRDF